MMPSGVLLPTILVLMPIMLMLMVVADVGLEVQRGGVSKEDAKIVIASYARFVQDKTEAVADEATLKRVIAGDKTLTPADMPTLWERGASPQYVNDLETVSKLRKAILRIKSADGRRFGFVERIGDNRYTVIVYGPPPAAKVKEWDDIKRDHDFQPCYTALGAVRLPAPKPERDAEGNVFPALHVIQTEMMKATQTSVRKEFCFSGVYY